MHRLQTIGALGTRACKRPVGVVRTGMIVSRHGGVQVQRASVTTARRIVPRVCRGPSNEVTGAELGMRARMALVESHTSTQGSMAEGSPLVVRSAGRPEGSGVIFRGQVRFSSSNASKGKSGEAVKEAEAGTSGATAEGAVAKSGDGHVAPVVNWSPLLQELRTAQTRWQLHKWSSMPTSARGLAVGIVKSVVTFSPTRAMAAVRPTLVRTYNWLRSVDFVNVWATVKRELRFYWSGLKLLYRESLFTWELLSRHFFTSEKMTRRERAQLWRTMRDLIKLGPFVLLLLLPGSGILLPMVARFFPNVLPSTFLSQVDTSDSMTIKKDVAQYLKFAIGEVMADSRVNQDLYDQAAANADVDLLLSKLQSGQLGNIEDEELINFLQGFTDDFIIDKLSLAQLFFLGQYLRVDVTGRVNGLRVRLKTKMRTIRNDDKLLTYNNNEFLEQLSSDELTRAAKMRRITGSSVEDLGEKLRTWTALSSLNVPLSVMILSGAFHSSPYSKPKSQHAGQVEARKRILRGDS